MNEFNQSTYLLSIETKQPQTRTNVCVSQSKLNKISQTIRRDEST
jgi:hypothetical protein